jgi:hypothetical protein
MQLLIYCTVDYAMFYASNIDTEEEQIDNERELSEIEAVRVTKIDGVYRLRLTL